MTNSARAFDAGPDLDDTWTVHQTAFTTASETSAMMPQERAMNFVATNAHEAGENLRIRHQDWNSTPSTSRAAPSAAPNPTAGTWSSISSTPNARPKPSAKSTAARSMLAMWSQVRSGDEVVGLCSYEEKICEMLALFVT
jgi:hypothetical protein